MKSDAFIQLALDTLSCSQKELAVRLKVSPAQISKWKKGEYMSLEMEEKLQAIVNIKHYDPEFVLWAGSLESAEKWEKLIHYLADIANDNSETGYCTEPLNDDMDVLCWNTFHVLREMGVMIPKVFPQELDVDYQNEDVDSNELWNLIENSLHASTIYKIYNSLNDVYGFYAAYIEHLVNDDELNLFDTPAGNIEPCLMSLAACKIDVDPQFAPKFGMFKSRIVKDYEEWLTFVKERAFRSGVPLGAELLGMIYNSHDALGHEAEAESLGFNSSRVHPDIYMNELLVGMRLIHQVLPVIMKKLGIDEEFRLDESEFHLGGK
ncbi:helix-turn-helix transcriptional regulator [Pectobacterium brasiliense]|uniref:helix-turn-helix domain-containing protein n=1 Tax=Pectobacterium brasiliense TaxID=180957 RepID=UPI00196976F5|nr:helix-turn-helix transcriptional regulator [Pectobacterium brasiliense]MBN3175795.1 helix-turn-helix transcriptional regulator [Pectobacterium brasiliense]MDY4384167.1 helix-turn-helix transcriptional regulator [Pectobacterium brasiliense]